MKKVDFTNEDRKIILQYLAAKAAMSAAKKAEETAKKAASELFKRLGKTYKDTEKTSYLYGAVQVKGEALAVVYKETDAKGTIDWQAYAKALGGTDEGAEDFRKPNTVRTSLDWATKTQQEEIGK